MQSESMIALEDSRTFASKQETLILQWKS